MRNPNDRAAALLAEREAAFQSLSLSVNDIIMLSMGASPSSSWQTLVGFEQEEGSRRHQALVRAMNERGDLRLPFTPDAFRPTDPDGAAIYFPELLPNAVRRVEAGPLGVEHFLWLLVLCREWARRSSLTPKDPATHELLRVAARLVSGWQAEQARVFENLKRLKAEKVAARRSQAPSPKRSRGQPKKDFSWFIKRADQRGQARQMLGSVKEEAAALFSIHAREKPREKTPAPSGIEEAIRATCRKYKRRGGADVV